jgi:hypothetical protein
MIICDNRGIDLDMVKAGYAWWYLKYADEQNAGGRILSEVVEDQAKRSGGRNGRTPILAAPGNVQKNSGVIDEENDVGASGPSFGVYDQPAC